MKESIINGIEKRSISIENEIKEEIGIESQRINRKHHQRNASASQASKENGEEIGVSKKKK